MICFNATPHQSVHIKNTFIERVEDLEVRNDDEPRRANTCPLFRVNRQISDPALEALSKSNAGFDENDMFVPDGGFEQGTITVQHLCTFDGSEKHNCVDEEPPLQPCELRRFRTFDRFEDYNVEDADSLLQPVARTEDEEAPLQRGELQRLRTIDGSECDNLEDEDCTFAAFTSANSPMDNASVTTYLSNFPNNANVLSGRCGCDEGRRPKGKITGIVPPLVAAGGLKCKQVVPGAMAFSKKDAFLHTTDLKSDVGCIEWIVDAKRFSSSDRQIVSPFFQLDVEAEKQLQLKFILHACGSKVGRGKASFRYSGGRGSLALKSDEVNLEGNERGSVTFRISVGDSYTEWLSHDFMKTPLLRCGEEWNFRMAVDKTTHAKVRLEVKTHSSIDP